MSLKNNSVLHILGGGPAGITSAYYAKKNKIPFILYESSNKVGGNCKTIIDGGYRFDIGAHRFHDKHDLATNEVKNLIGDDLLSVNAPSKIFFKDSMIDFPLSLSNIMMNLDWGIIIKAITENVYNITKYFQKPNNFKDLAYQTYGKTLSNLFLINYTEKLWGRKADNLDIKISGNRLKHLNLTTFFRELLFKSDNVNHLDGSFYYPRHGFGTIFEKMKDYIGEDNIRFDSPIKKVIHKDQKILEVYYGNSRINNVDMIINTLPVNTLINSLDPSPPENIKNIVNTIKYRDLKLCVIYLDTPSFTNNASIYFPESIYPFTRIYEPKNRSKDMAPNDKTCIVIEIPFDQDTELFSKSNKELFENISDILINNKLIKRKQIIDHKLIEAKYAYPILEIGLKYSLKNIFSYLNNFENMHIVGRNAQFKYIHTHDIFMQANSIINKLLH